MIFICEIDDYKVLYNLRKKAFFYFDGKKYYKVTDSNEIKTYKIMLDANIKVNKHRILKKTTIAALLTTASIGLGLNLGINYIPNNETKIAYVLNQETSSNLYYDALKNNPTLTIKERNSLIPYIDILSASPFNKTRNLSIVNNIKKYDFSTFIDCEREIKCFLDDILEMDDYGFTVNQVYAAVNGYDNTKEINYIANLLVEKEDSIECLLNSQSLEKTIKKHFKEIDPLRFMIVVSDYQDLIDDDINKYLISKKLYEIKRTPLEKELFTTEFFNGTSTLESNIFKNEQVIIMENGHKKYFKSGIDVTDNHYRDWYFDLLSSYDRSFDDPDQRFMCFVQNSKDLDDALINTDIGIMLYLIYDNKYSNIISMNDIHDYYYGNYNYNERLSDFSVLAYFGEDALESLQNIDYCLALEVKNGNLKKEKYQLFINEVNMIFDVYYPHLYNNWQLFGISVEIIPKRHNLV